jgi:hypothetical protein
MEVRVSEAAGSRQQAAVASLTTMVVVMIRALPEHLPAFHRLSIFRQSCVCNRKLYAADQIVGGTYVIVETFRLRQQQQQQNTPPSPPPLDVVRSRAGSPKHSQANRFCLGVDRGR